MAEKGASFDFVPVDLAKREHKSPEHLARQPFGVVPVLEDDGFRLYESRAIVRYLDARLPGAALVPADLRDRARMEQWISVESSYFSPPAMRAVMNLFYAKMSGGQHDPAVVAKGTEEAGKALDVLERALDGAEWLAGSFSLAEVCYAPYLQYLVDLGQGDVVTSRPNVAAWWNRVSARPAWQKAIGRG